MEKEKGEEMKNCETELITIDELQEQVPEINWLKYINSFLPEDNQMKGSSQVRMDIDMEQLQQIISLVEAEEPESVPFKITQMFKLIKRGFSYIFLKNY